MNSKKVVLFIVEGKYDVEIIRSLLHIPQYKHILDKYAPIIKPLNYDITADYNVYGKKIIRRVGAIVEECVQREPQLSSKKDIDEVFQIIDLDGAYVPDDSIMEKDCNDIYYKDDGIETYNANKILDRNNKKRNKIDTLYYLNDIKGIEYSLYYASCNMDHVIFNERNLDKKNKYEANDQLSRNGEKNKILEELINDEQIIYVGKHESFEDNYRDSWNYISQEGFNSLSRKTNINLCLDKLLAKCGD